MYAYICLSSTQKRERESGRNPKRTAKKGERESRSCCCSVLFVHILWTNTKQIQLDRSPCWSSSSAATASTVAIVWLEGRRPLAVRSTTHPQCCFLASVVRDEDQTGKFETRYLLAIAYYSTSMCTALTLNGKKRGEPALLSFLCLHNVLDRKSVV